MKKKEILEKYQIKRGTFDRLRYDGKIVKLSFYDFSIDEEFMKTFNEEQYTKEWKERPEQKARIAERNRKVNEARWSNISDEKRQEFREKVSKGVRKTQAENPECIEAMKRGLKEYWSKEENRKTHRNKMLHVYSDPKKRKNISKGCKKHWSNEDVREAKRQQMLQYWSEHPEKIEQMKETNRRVQKALWTPEKRLQQSEKLKALWNTNKSSIAAKRLDTMRRNNSFSKSKPAENCIELLRNYGFTVETEKSYPEKPEYPCDAYIVELDTWIEFHFGFFHCHEPFIGTPEQLQQVKEFEQKEQEFKLKHPDTSHGQYGDRIRKWTIIDVEKRQIAERNNLTWFAFYSTQEFEEWLSILLK